MRQFSNRYMLLYALALAAVVALLLTVVATGLKEQQQRNVRNEQKQMLLASIGVSCERDNAETEYPKYFKEESNIAADGEEPLILYRYEKEGCRGVVIPATGNGLWGKIYANIALADDLNTIVGITFSHEGETPGLGAEITSEEFCKQFIGKKILDDNGTIVSVAVVKHAEANHPHQVDAISGGTMTSNGVSQMLHDVLTQYQYFVDTERKEVPDGQ